MTYDAILIAGGGITEDGKPNEWGKRRLDKALEVWKGEFLITLSGGTVHKPPVLTNKKFVIHEAAADANYLLEKGADPKKVFVETASRDTIGNAYFARVIHTDPRGWRKLLVITSEFHMPRTKEIFEWIFGFDATPAYELDFLSASDEGISEDILIPRIKKERKSIERLRKEKERVKTFKEFHTWLFSEHGAYALDKQPEKESDDVLKSY